MSIMENSREEQTHDCHQQQPRVDYSSCLAMQASVFYPRGTTIVMLSIYLFTLLKTWSLRKIIPPLKKAHPRTSNMFDRIEPKSDCWTTRIIPLLSANIEMISSVAFPNVAFKRPPTVHTITCIRNRKYFERLVEFGSWSF